MSGLFVTETARSALCLTLFDTVKCSQRATKDGDCVPICNAIRAQIQANRLRPIARLQPFQHAQPFSKRPLTAAATFPAAGRSRSVAPALLGATAEGSARPELTDSLEYPRHLGYQGKFRDIPDIPHNSWMCSLRTPCPLARIAP